MAQSKLSFWRGRDTGKDEQTERKRKREGEEDERGRGGTAHCAQDRISITSLCCSAQTKTNLIQFKQCHLPQRCVFSGNYSEPIGLTTQTPSITGV